MLSNELMAECICGDHTRKSWLPWSRIYERKREIGMIPMGSVERSEILTGLNPVDLLEQR
jgi:hypothetical protein